MPLALNEINDPSTRKGVSRLQADVRQNTPNIKWEYVTVTFPATINTDTIIPINLSPDDPEDVNYVVVDYQLFAAPATTPCIYRDTSSTRKPWGKGYVVLRCNVASVKVQLLLQVARMTL